VIVGFPGETAEDFEQTVSLLDEVQFDGVFAFKYSPRPNTPALSMIDSISEEEKSRRLAILMDHQRKIQKASYMRHVGEIAEVMVEGRNEARAQWMGRTSQNKTLNFTAPGDLQPGIGSYTNVRVTASFPNSLVGEMVV
jgi:tRNA-2-methylthio-N6-dimethylallyladenosine synthase